MIDEAIPKIARDLQEGGIYYVFPVFPLTGRENRYGYCRTSLTLSVILSPEGLAIFCKNCVGRGYEYAVAGASKAFRRTEDNLPLDIITSNEYPGDGLPKAVRFPDPATDYVVIDGIRTMPLPRLVEPKLASGMTGRGRLKDLSDVQEPIRTLALPADFALELDPTVRAKFAELYDDLHGE